MKYAGLAALLCVLVIESAPGQEARTDKRTWRKVQYLGGALGVPKKSLTWKNDLVVSPEVIQLSSKGRVLFRIDPKQVTALAYERQRVWKPSHVAGAALIGAATPFGAAPLAILSLASKNNTEHYIAIEYTLPDGHGSGVLLRADKSNFKEIVSALRSVTGVTETPPPPSTAESKDQGTDKK